MLQSTGKGPAPDLTPEWVSKPQLSDPSPRSRRRRHAETLRKSGDDGLAADRTSPPPSTASCPRRYRRREAPAGSPGRHDRKAPIRTSETRRKRRALQFVFGGHNEHTSPGASSCAQRLRLGPPRSPQHSRFLSSEVARRRGETAGSASAAAGVQRRPRHLQHVPVQSLSPWGAFAVRGRIAPPRGEIRSIGEARDLMGIAKEAKRESSGQPRLRLPCRTTRPGTRADRA